jgi:iron complex transport system ATP-binding protein
MIPAGTPLLDATGLDVTIGPHAICRGLDLRIERGERLAILGRNGAGKSTLLSTLAGLRPPVAGKVRLGGDDIATLHVKEAARRRGYLPQTQHDAFATTVLETALIGRHPHLSRFAWESADDEAFARTALDFVGLAGMETRTVQSLSGGERQRLGVATLLTQEPDLYLLDEPLAHLDLNHAIAALDVLSRCAEHGAGVAMVLHEPSLAARYCDRVLLLFGDGRCELGDVMELLTADRLSALYGHPMRALDDRGRPWFVPG